MKWFRKAANQGNAHAQYNLGVMYNNGKGVTQDYKEAIKWHRKAANQGYVHAQNNLGTMYGNGQGVTQDYVLAHMWWNLAASQGDKTALRNRNIVEKRMTPSQVEKAQELARKFRVKKQ